MFKILQGDLVHNNPNKYLLSVFSELEIQSQKIAYLPDSESWNADILVLDYRHHYYSDDIFVKYVNSLRETIGEDVLIRFADLPFSYENSGNLNKQFGRLINRTKIAHKVLGSSGRFISPAICLSSENVAKLYLQYFRECGCMFDAYSLDCSMEGTDREVAVLTSLLNGILSHEYRKVIITGWATSSGNSHSMQSCKLAAIRMRSVYSMINNMIPDSEWYISCFGRDYYDPSKSPESFAYEYPYTSDEAWTNRNFMGLLSYMGEPKWDVVQALSDIVLGDKSP